jgi:biotin carboxyl carrier protein
VWRYEVEIGGRIRDVVVHKSGGRFEVTVDGHPRIVDAARLGGHLWSLLLDQEGGLSGASHEVSIGPEPQPGRLSVQVGSTPLTAAVNGRRRWSRQDRGAQASSGQQRILASMSGKVVRVLVQQGQAVQARQPLVVVEAMKMENELSAGHDGTVADIAVRDGQSVDAGALLIVIV